MSLASRFFAKVNMNGPIPTEHEDMGNCWIWMGSLTKHGYGQIYVKRNSVTGKRIIRGAHLVALELDGQIVDPALEPDHLCRNRLCVRPTHLEMVTHQENARRRTRPTCKRGHPFADNMVQNGGGGRTCKTCKYERMHDRRVAAKTGVPTQ